MSKINLGVIFGGMSTENEVSVVSGTSVVRNLDKEKYNIYPIYISKNGEWFRVENLLENSAAKLTKKNADMICANSLTVPGAGYKVDTNIITLIKRSADSDKPSLRELPLMTKDDAAYEILSEIIKK